MNNLIIQIISGKTAILEIRNSYSDFGLFSISPGSYVIGFRDNPLFALEQSLVNERLYIEPLPDGRIIVRENIRFDNESEKWMFDSCCDDFSIFNHLPDGRYMLVKTERKLKPAGSILMGNEWSDSEKNIFCFDGSDGNKISPLKQGKKNGVIKEYYSMVIGTDPDLLPYLKSPLLSVIIPEYGIVWDGATGFVFFTSGRKESGRYSDKDIILVIPCMESFLINPFKNYQFIEDEIMKDIESFAAII